MGKLMGVERLFEGRHFDREVIILCDTTIMRWIQCYVPEFEKRWNGTVKLTEPRARGDEFWSRWASGEGACVGDLAPDSKAAVTRSAAGCSRCRFWIRDVKEVRDLIVNRQEPLRLPG